MQRQKTIEQAEIAITGLVKTLTTKDIITPNSARKATNITNPQTIKQVLQNLHYKGMLIKRGPIQGNTYGINPGYRH